MNETVKEWVTKAGADFATAGRELSAEERPNYDAVCFHAQQCVEKLMKGLLILGRVIPPKSHDLPQLGELIAKAYPQWSWPIEELRFLTRAAVDFRYPGEAADRKEAQGALDIASRMREKLLSLLQEPA